MRTDKLIEEAFEAPAEMLEAGTKELHKIERAITHKKSFKTIEEYLHSIGPGLTTGAADDDPSGIATYSQAGAQYGFNLLWMSLFSYPLMAVVQEMCARIAIVTGRGLAANIRLHFPTSILYIATALLFMANTFNIGADLGAMAKATQLILPQIPFLAAVLGFTVVSVLLQVFTSYAQYARYMKYLTFALLGYVATALLVHIDWHAALTSTVIPSFPLASPDGMLLVCAILGTTISPYLFFWQPSQEVEEEILHGEKTVAQRAQETPHKAAVIADMRVDVWTGMFFSNIVMFFIIAATAATLYTHGITDIQTADQAALALRPFAGDLAYLLFAIGIIGTGMLAVPVLAGSSSYAIAESFRWKTGLYRKLKDAYAFYGVIIVATLVGMAINFIGMDPMKALIYSAVANGLVAPVMLVFIVLLSSNKRVMGPHTNNTWLTIVGWTTVVLMSIAGSFAAYSFFV